jgi:hypothetical protein
VVLFVFTIETQISSLSSVLRPRTGMLLERRRRPYRNKPMWPPSNIRGEGIIACNNFTRIHKYRIHEGNNGMTIVRVIATRGIIIALSRASGTWRLCHFASNNQ